MLWQPRVRVDGNISGSSGEITVVTAGDVLARTGSGKTEEEIWADVGNYGIVIPTVNLHDAFTEDNSGGNITDAPVKLVLNTVSTIASWRRGEPDPAPDGPAWIVRTYDFLSTSGTVSP